MPLTNADLAQQVTSLISRWDTYTKQLRDWLAGTPDGGPYGDGRYPLQNSLGQVFYVPCPAAQSAMVEGNAASAKSFATQAATHALAAVGAKAAAEAARDLALTYRDAAQAAKALAETARNEAQTAEANARYWAEQAQVTAGGVNTVAADVAEAADAVAADRAAAEAARVAAEAAKVAAELAAQQAATFNPANYAPVNHTHAIADVTGLQAALANKANSSHAHAIADVTGLQEALANKANSSHTHAIADVTGLQEALANKADSSHAHTIADVSGLRAALDAKMERVLEYSNTDANSLPAGNWLGNFLGETTTNTPTGSWTHFLQSTNTNKTWGFQLAKPWFQDELYLRSLANGGWSNWFRLWHSGNLDVSALNRGGRLGPNSKTISNWDDAVENGYYMAFNAANSPISNEWLMGRVVSHNSFWVEQEVWVFTDGRIPQPRWVRVKRNGTWSAWGRWGARLWLEDTRYTMPQPNQFAGLVRHWDFKHQNDTGAGGRGWHAVLTVAPWLNYHYDHPQQQLVWRGDGLSYRSAVDGATWGPYKHLVTSPQAATEIFVQTADPGAVGAGKIWIKPV